MENINNTAEFTTVTFNQTSDFTPLIDIQPIYTTKEAALPIIKKVAKSILEDEMGLGRFVRENPDHDFSDMLASECYFFELDTSLFTPTEWKSMANEFITQAIQH